MNIVFMGTPGFAVPSLEKLIKDGHSVKAVITAPDKERGRGQKVSFTEVKQFALDNNLPVLQPSKLKDEQFINTLKEINADLFVVVAFRILPAEVFTLPKYGSFNLHGSLLPKYRGAAPIQWAIINGETETGVTTFKLEPTVDTGNIYLRKTVPINIDDNFETIHDKLSIIGAAAVAETVEMIEKGNYELQPQDNALATPAPKITKETGLIDWSKPAEAVNNLIRGLSPYPGAYFFHNSKQIKIYKAAVIEDKEMAAGSTEQHKESLYIGCGTGALEVLELQLEGRKKLSVREFLRGYNF